MKPQNSRLAAIAVALGISSAIAVQPTSTFAGVIESTGAIAFFGEPPESVRKFALQSSTEIVAFQEQFSFTLDQRVRIDAWLPGSYDQGADLGKTWIDAGTLVNSYFVHQDSIRHDGAIILAGSLTFDEEILGVITRKGSLRLSDGSLGAASTQYPLSRRMGRGLELNPLRDWFTISDDRRTITFNLRTRPAVDQIRIITAAAPVPAPGALLALVAGICSIKRRRRTV